MAITYVAGGASISDNVTGVTGLSWPPHAAGAFAALIWALVNTATPSLDSNFTERDNDADGSLRAILAERLPGDMTGSESGAISLTSGATSNRMSAVLVVFSGVQEIAQIVQVQEGVTAVSEHPFGPLYANELAITPLHDNSTILLVYAERLSSGVTVGEMTPPSLAGAAATIRQERGTGGSGGTYVCIADKALGSGTAGVQQVFTQWNAPAAKTTANAEMYLIELRALITAHATTASVRTSGGTAAVRDTSTTASLRSPG